MAMIETWFDQDLLAPVPVHVLSGVVFDQDSLGNLIGVRITKDGEPVTLTGSVNGYCILSDGSTIPVDGIRDASGNSAWIVLPQSAYLVLGTISIVIKLTDGNTITTICACVGTVRQSKTSNMVEPGSTVITDWSQQISAELQACQDAADNMGANLASNYSTTATYPVGSYVMYNGTLYRCVTAVTTAGSWSSNSSKFVATKLANDVADLKSAIKLNVANADENNGYTSITFPGVINGSNKWTGTADSTHCLIPVLPGDTVYLKRSGSLACVCAILTGNAGAVNGETPPFSSASGFTGRIVVSETDDITFTVPQDGQYLYLTNTTPNYTFLPTRISVNGNDYTIGIRKFLTDKALKYIQVSQSTAETVYGKLAANLPGNSYCWVDGSWFTDAPSGTYWLFTIASKAEIESFAWQFTFNPTDTKIWSRQKKYVNSEWVWADWIDIPKFTDILSYRGIVGNNSDLNNLTGIGIYGINSEHTIAHKPSWMNGGMLFVIPYSNSIIVQIATGIGNHFSQRAIVGETVYDWTEDLSITQTALTSLTDKALKYIQVSQSTAETEYGKLAANLPGNSFVWVSSDWFTDLPSGTWWVVTISSASTGIARGQIAYAPTGVVWTRQKPATGEFGEWALLSYANGTPFNYGVLATGTDLNTITKNSIYGLNSTGNYTNKPTGLNSGYLFTVVYGSGFVTQFATKLNGSVIYTRFKNSSNVWSDWTDGNHDPSAKYFAFGDSTTYGQIGGVSPAQQSKYNYPACIGKALGMATYNKAKGGQGLLKDWSYIQTNYITNLDMTGAKLITVGWAYNDNDPQSPVRYGTTPFGAYTDTVEAGDTPTTVIGYYYRIMADFQTKCPDAKIVLITGYGKPDGQVNPVVKPTLVHQFDANYTFADGQHTCKELYDTLEAMCNLHGWSCVNQSKGTVFNFCNASTLIGDQIHPNNDGYLLYGNFLAARVSSLYANISSSAF